MPERPNASLGVSRAPQEAGADLASAMAEILAHHPRFLDQIHAARPLFFRATVTALQTTGGVRQVQVQRTGQAQPDSAWYPILDAGYVATVGDDVLLCYVDQRFSACVIGARTQTSPATSTLSTTSLGQSYLPLTVTNNSSTQAIGGSVRVPVPTTSTDYVVQCHLSGTTATQVWNALSDKTSYSDLQVVFGGAEIDADIDQQTNGAWSSSNQTLWFRLQRSIAASGTDQGYQLRLGGAVRSSPPRSWANIYPFSDDFAAGALDATKWTQSNSPSITVSGGQLTLSGPTNAADHGIIGTSAFGAGYLLAARASLGQNNAAADAEIRLHPSATNALFALPIFVVANYPAGHAGTFYAEQQTVSQDSGALALAALDSSMHIWQLARDGAGTGHAWQDATAVVSSTAFSTSAAYPCLSVYCPASGQTGTLVCDWVKVRPWISTEPTCTAGTLQSAGGLRWEPVVDTSGSVIVSAAGDPLMALTSAT